MSETINVAITANAAELETALAKASASVSRFEKKARSARQIGLPSLELSPASLQSMERATFLQQNLTRATYEAGKSGKAGSLGFLAFSQAVEDAQYGVKGVLNNIPQMVLGFGGGAGLAGVLSLAAVAAYVAYQAFMKFSGINAMETWAKDSTAANEAFTVSLAKAREETAALSREIERQAVLASARDAGMRNISQRIATDPGIEAALAERNATRDRRRGADDALISAASSGISGVTGETPSQQAQREVAAARLKFGLQEKRLIEEIATAQEDLNLVTTNYNRLLDGTATITADLSAKRKQQEADLVEYTAKLKTLQAEQQRADAIQKSAGADFDTKRRAARENGELKRQIAQIQELIKAKKQELDLTKDLQKEADSAATATEQSFRAKQKALQDQVAVTKEAIAENTKLAQTEKQLITLRALQAQEGKLRAAADKAEATKDATNRTADLLEERSKRQQDEIDVGRGGAEKFAKLREQRREAQELAKGTNIPADVVNKELERQRQLQDLIDGQQGSAAARGDARREQRREDRAQARADARVRAALNRENRNREKRGEDPLDKPVAEIGEARRKARQDANAANDALGQNIAKQVGIQEELKTLLQKIEPRLPTHALRP